MRRGLVACVLCLWAAGAVLAWTPIGPGIEYAEFSLPHPNKAFVARMDRENTACFVDSTLGGGRLGVSETIGSQASRYDDAVGYWDQDWGQRNDVVVAINGDFLDTSTNTPLSGHIMSGWYTKILSGSGRRFHYGLDQALGLSQTSPIRQQVVFLDTGQTQEISGLNRTRGADELIIYTHQYDSNTKTDSTGVEVLIEMTRPVLISAGSDPPVGYVRQIRQNAGATVLPFDHVVISATGTAATNLLSRVQVGSRVGIRFDVAGYPNSMSGTYASVGGGETFLGFGQVWGGQEVRHPRTAIAFNDKYLYFVVVDGRSSISVGMTMTELGTFCKDYLDATWGINQDGGGSSTILVNGVLKNKPSDGSQRAVVNGMFMGIRQPKLQSSQFNAGDVVRTTGSSNNVRLGPGTNYLVATTVGSGVQATVLDHALGGIYAKGNYWWKCSLGGTTGWISQSLLTRTSAGNLPRFTQQPSARYVCPGGTAVFSVAATGTGTLTYRWERNGTPISEGPHYSGTNTPNLSVNSAGATETGSYRCVVTDANGSTTSWSAPLRVMVSTAILAQPEPRVDPLVSRGTDVIYTVQARGEGVLSYRWSKNGEALVDSAEYAGTTTSALTVKAVDTSDEGAYACTVFATCGEIQTAPAGLKVRSADFDRDGDVDQSDFAVLQSCYTGPTIAITDPVCLGADLDADGTDDADVADFAVFLQCFGGPDVPRRPGC